jgi:hypothetical protein
MPGLDRVGDIPEKFCTHVRNSTRFLRAAAVSTYGMGRKNRSTGHRAGDLPSLLQHHKLARCEKMRLRAVSATHRAGRPLQIDVKARDQSLLYCHGRQR